MGGVLRLKLHVYRNKRRGRNLPLWLTTTTWAHGNKQPAETFLLVVRFTAFRRETRFRRQLFSPVATLFSLLLFWFQSVTTYRRKLASTGRQQTANRSTAKGTVRRSGASNQKRNGDWLEKWVRPRQHITNFSPNRISSLSSFLAWYIKNAARKRRAVMICVCEMSRRSAIAFRQSIPCSPFLFVLWALFLVLVQILFTTNSTYSIYWLLGRCRSTAERDGNRCKWGTRRSQRNSGAV